MFFSSSDSLANKTHLYFVIYVNVLLMFDNKGQFKLN